MVKNIITHIIVFGITSLILILFFNSFLMPFYVRMDDGRYMVNVINKDINYAENILKAEGYKSLISDTLFTAKFQQGTVVDQYPTPNTRVKEGRTVRLKIAYAEKMVQIPTS